MVRRCVSITQVHLIQRQ